ELEGVEVFPKQDSLEPKTPVGSLVRGPLGIHRLTGKRYPFVDAANLEPVSRSVVGTLEYLAEVRPLSAVQVAEGLSELLRESRRPEPAPVPEARPAPEPTSEVGRLTLRRSPVEQIKEAIDDPYDFISRFVELDEQGRGHCPFHPPDVHPSFAVNRKLGHWV